MKGKLILFLAVAAAAMAFGANSTFAATLSLNPATGELTYATNDADAARDPTLKNDVEIYPESWPTAPTRCSTRSRTCTAPTPRTP